MPYRIVIGDSAKKAIRDLPKKEQARVVDRIAALADNPRPPKSRKLEGEDAAYRIRSGDYRVVYQIQDEVLLIAVVRVAHRRDVYRKK